MVSASLDPRGNFDVVYLKKALKNPIGGICFNYPFSKIYNGIYIWNQQELLYKMVYKLYDLIKVGQKPPLNGHGPLLWILRGIHSE